MFMRRIIAAIVPRAAINWFSVSDEMKTPIAMNAAPERIIEMTLHI